MVCQLQQAAPVLLNTIRDSHQSSSTKASCAVNPRCTMHIGTGCCLVVHWLHTIPLQHALQGVHHHPSCAPAAIVHPWLCYYYAVQEQWMGCSHNQPLPLDVQTTAKMATAAPWRAPHHNTSAPAPADQLCQAERSVRYSQLDCSACVIVCCCIH